MLFVKLFPSLYTGSLRGDSHGQLVFLNMLANADPDGRDDRHPRVMADEIGLSIEQTKVAIARLSDPDKESRTAADEGRRIRLLDGHRGWGRQIVNFEQYQATKDPEQRRAQNRAAQARFRDKGEPEPEKTKRPARKCPADWIISPALATWADTKAPSMSVAALAVETDKFRDHTFRTAITDWDGAWRNWIRRSANDGPVAKSSAAKSFDQQRREGNAATAARAIAEANRGTR
jgi:hypothetical protein